MNDFTYTPGFDYYELFEAMLGDDRLEVMNDPEDFAEFEQMLKEGFNPIA
jgi:hypothetical protein|tara:strand:+ start:348 stop:497 length:150 start_codon:yes stop_codon:yes gene_type:complete